MTLVADADVPDQVIRSLQAVKYPILRLIELGLPLRPDRDVMGGLVSSGNRVLVTRDCGIPSQAYLFQYAARGITVVVLRWKKSDARAFQQMVRAVLTHGEEWERAAAERPCVISVNNRSSRARPWATIPPSIGDPARGLAKD